jgi:hypothetical protein
MTVEVEVVIADFVNSWYGNRNGSHVPSHVLSFKMSKSQRRLSLFHIIHCEQGDIIILFLQAKPLGNFGEC